MDFLRILSDQRDELLATDTTSLCSRKEESNISLDSKLAQIVIGVRRSGKSTLCQKVLLQSNVNFAYVNFDDERLIEIKTDQLDEFLQTLYRLNGQFTHLFLDEIQNIKGWPLFVNRLLRQGLHLILTGSNANLLSAELSTHLTGRYHQIELYPFSFSEYCQATKVDISSHSTKASALRLRALDKYLLNGGFPELVETDMPSDYTKSLLNAIVNKDICRRYNVRYKETLWRLANLALDRFCQEISYHDVSKSLSIQSIHTAKNYMAYLENAYLVQSLPKFSYKTTERQSGKKYYAVDMAFISNHDNIIQSDNLGWRLENTIAIELMRRLNKESDRLYYLRKHKNFEVDFIITERTHIKELIQVCYDFTKPSTKLYNREIGGLIKGAEFTGCNNLTLIIMQGESRDIFSQDKTIKIVTATDWLLNR